MAKQKKKTTKKQEIQFEPGCVVIMTVVVSVLTLVFIATLTTL